MYIRQCPTFEGRGCLVQTNPVVTELIRGVLLLHNGHNNYHRNFGSAVWTLDREVNYKGTLQTPLISLHSGSEWITATDGQVPG